MKNVEIKNFSEDDALARAAAHDWLDVLDKTTRFHCVAVSGGRIAKNFFCAVAELSKINPGLLRKVEFFWADERCVPPDHPDSNYLLAWENLLQPLAVAPEKIHRLKGELAPAAAVAEANATIGRIAPKNSAGAPALDLVILGIGENGHVASLMPNLPESAVRTQTTYLRIEKSPKPPPDRISLSYAAIAAAKAVWVLASGAGKEDAMRQSLQPGGQTALARVLQSRTRTVIYSDISI